MDTKSQWGSPSGYTPVSTSPTPLQAPPQVSGVAQQYSPQVYYQPVYGTTTTIVQQQPVQQLQNKTIFVTAPQGIYPVPGQVNLVAIPNGQVHEPGSLNVAVAHLPPIYGSGESDSGVRGKVNTCIACYIVGFFFYFPYLASIIISLMFCSQNYIVEKKGIVILFSTCELIGWLFLPCFVWYSDYSNCTYYGYCDVMWWGWIALIVFFSFAIIFGIPRVILTVKCEKLRNRGPQVVHYHQQAVQQPTVQQGLVYQAQV